MQGTGWPPEPVWTGAEILDPTSIRPRTVQPVASRSSDYALLAHSCCHETKVKYKFTRLPFYAFIGMELKAQYNCVIVSSSMIFVQTSKNNAWNGFKVVKRNRPVLCALMETKGSFLLYNQPSRKDTWNSKG